MNCPLCTAEHVTRWFSEDEICWVALCKTCSVPMVVAQKHGADVPPAVREHMITCLREAADVYFGGVRPYELDTEMRAIPGHTHFHARPHSVVAQRHLMSPLPGTF